MPFLRISIKENALGYQALFDDYLVMQREITEIVADKLSYTVPRSGLNLMRKRYKVIVEPGDFDVTIHNIDSSRGERQKFAVELFITAIGYPDRMKDRMRKANRILAMLKKLYPKLSFGVFLDLKPDAVWAE